MATVKIVLEGGPKDGEKLNIDGNAASPPPNYLVADTSEFVVKRYMYQATPIVRPWTDQTWSWVYQYCGEY